MLYCVRKCRLSDLNFLPSSKQTMYSGVIDFFTETAPGGFGEKVDHAGIHCLLGRRQEIQVAQAAFAHAVQHDARAVPGKMGARRRLSDGRAQLRGRALATGQANGFRPAAPPPRQIKTSSNRYRIRAGLPPRLAAAVLFCTISLTIVADKNPIYVDSFLSIFRENANT